MTLKMRDSGGTLRTITRIRMRDSGGTIRTIQKIRGRDGGGTLRTLFAYLSLTLDYESINGIDSGVAYSGVVTTASVTGTVVGGTGPFVYAWTRISGDAEIGITSPAAVATTFSGTCYDGVLYEATFRLTVTDANGATVTDDVIVSITWVNEA